MSRVKSRSRKLAAAGVAVAALAVGQQVGESRAARSPIAELAGRWAGAGTVQWRNGREEPYKCVVTYFLGDNGGSVRQNLRCQNAADMKLDIGTQMRIEGGKITGTWEERQYNMTGGVEGRVTEAGYEVLASNQFFKAQFEIAVAGTCKQTVTIRPNRDIALITADLKKC